MRGAPSEGTNFIGAEAIAMVMSFPARIGDGANERVGLAQRLKQHLHDLLVWVLLVTTDVVDLADTAVMQHKVYAAAVIHHIDPIANLGAVAIERHFFVVYKAGDEERQQLFWILIGAEIDAAAGN